jgi:starvation-inducible DNA-binding protein
MTQLQALKTTPQPDNPDNGLSAKAREKLVNDLRQILADNYVLTIKTHLYHWNVVGPLFKSVHDLTEEHYKNLFAASDELAERIRALGFLATVQTDQLSLTAKAVSPQQAVPDTQHMLEDLVFHHDHITSQMREASQKAGELGDAVTEDMLIARMGFHEKAAWMLRAFLTQ